MCEAQNDMDVVTLTTEEEGVGLVCGAWAGGRKGVLLMQSSGVGNCINALALPVICRIPFLTIVSMRGEWGEFIPWQVPMGQGTPKVLEAMDVQRVPCGLQGPGGCHRRGRRESAAQHPPLRSRAPVAEDDRRQAVQGGMSS